MTEMDLVAVAGGGEIGADHTDCLRFLARGVHTVEKLPMGTISFVKGLLQLLGRGQNDKAKGGVLYIGVSSQPDIFRV